MSAVADPPAAGALVADPPAGGGGTGPQAVPEVTAQIRGSSLLLFGRLLSLATNLGVQVVLVRSLTKGDYGLFAYALSVVSTIATLSTLGLDRGLARFVATYEERGERARFWGTIVLQLSTIGGIGLAAIGLVIGLRPWIGEHLVDDTRLASLLAVMVLLAPVQALDNVAATLFAAFSGSRAIFFRRYVLAPCLRLAVVVLLALAHGDVFFLGVGYVVSGLFGLAVYGSLLRRTLRERGLLGGATTGPRLVVPFREVGSFTVPLLVSDLMFVVLNTSDVVILGRVAGAAQVAAYRAVLPVARLNQLVMNSFSLLFAPLMARLWARGDRHALSEAYWQTAAWVAVLTFPIFAFALGMAAPLTTGLFGDRYADATTYLRILAVAYYFNAVLGFNGVTLKMIGRVWLSAATAGAALVFNLAANLLLIPRYGALGAAYGTAASVVLYNLLKQWALHRASGLALFDRRYLPIYAGIAGSSVVLLLVELAAAPVALRLVAVTGLSAAVLLGGRRLLLVDELFPELRRIPLLGRLVGRPVVAP